ncbi:MAG TPA: ABC transporter permease [Chloroflexota bacterium]
MQNVIDLIQPGLQLAAPLILAAIGGLFSYRAGVFNIALEGFMLVAAFFSVSVTSTTGSMWIGVAAGVGCAMLMAAFMGIAVMLFAADEVIVGIALNLFALGLTTFLLSNGGSGGGGFIRLSSGLPALQIGAISGIPVVNDVINGRDPLVCVSWLSIPVAAWILKNTLFGLQLRAVGESPLAARAAGVKVGWVKFSSFVISGFFCGLAGVELALGSVYLFSENMTNGRGIIAFAAVIFGAGTPLLVGLASLMFGFAQALAGQLQIGSRFPPQFVLMTPYVFAIVALVLSGQRQRQWLRRRAFGHAAEQQVEPTSAAIPGVVAADAVTTSDPAPNASVGTSSDSARTS